MRLTLYVYKNKKAPTHGPNNADGLVCVSFLFFIDVINLISHLYMHSLLLISMYFV